MRQIGTIAHESLADRFSSYLLVRGIANTIEPSQSGDWTVWVDHEDQLDQAVAELERFNNNPNDAQYDAKSAAAKLRAQQEKSARIRRKNFHDVRTRWGQPAQWKAPLTLILIILCIFATAATHFGSFDYQLSDWLFITRIHIVDNGPMREYLWQPGLTEIRHGQVWRLITPIFMHAGWMHIIFNMFWLRDLGAMIETRKGTWFLLILVLVSAVLSNLAQYYSTPFFLGISGVVYALFGYVWIKGRIDPASGIGISRENAIIMIAWLFLCMTGWIGPIANSAHVIGILVGVAFAYIPHYTRRLLR